MRIFYTVLAILLTISVIVTTYVVRLMSDMGSFRTIEAHFDGTCTTIPGFAGGTEDLAIDRETGWIFVSAYDRWAMMAGENNTGAIQAFRAGAPEDGILTLTDPAPQGFRPHGISLYSGPDGKRLFVISHAPDGSQRIELFDVTYIDGAPALAHAETITDPLIVSPNDLQAVGMRQFYVGNDSQHTDHTTFAYNMELYLRLSQTNVVYYDGTSAHVAAPGLTYTNGVAMSNDGRTLYVAETTDGTLRIYDRDPETGDLTQREGSEGILRFGTGLDNIDVDAEGRIWLGAHPKIFDFAEHARDPSALSPAQIIMIDPSDDGVGGHIHEVYMGDGSLASGSAVGAYYEGLMYIGLVFRPDVVMCAVDDPLVVGE